MSKITKKNLKLRLDALNAENGSQHEFMMRIKRALKSIDINVMDSDFDNNSSPDTIATIERKAELKGSDLCRAMLARGDKCVLVRMGVRDDKQAKMTGRVAVAIGIDMPSGSFRVMSDQQPITRASYAIPVNNKGEPLTAKDAGL